MEDGVWRTIGGRRIFIKDGQDLASAMKKSGKFTKKQKDAGERLSKNAENGVRSDIKDFLSGREDYDGSREDFINDLSDEWQVERDKVEEILHEESSKHPRNFNSKVKISDEQREKNIEELKKNYQEYLKNYDYDKEKPEGQKMVDLFEKEGIKGITEKNEGYKTYLKDKYGTSDENIVSAGYKSKEKLYQEYKDETMRNINKARMERGVTNINDAYKKAFNEYKKKHPNTKLSLNDFIKMSEE